MASTTSILGLEGAAPGYAAQAAQLYNPQSVGLPLKIAWKLHLVQNATARLLKTKNHSVSITSHLHWLPISDPI